jgi:hypothetical protein
MDKVGEIVVGIQIGRIGWQVGEPSTKGSQQLNRQYSKDTTVISLPHSDIGNVDGRKDKNKRIQARENIAPIAILFEEFVERIG